MFFLFMYMMKCNAILFYAFIGAISSVWAASALVTASATSSEMRDSRDGKIYRTVFINGKTWMAENLNYKMEKSKCYENKDRNCKNYGRLYSFEAAVKACPAGWHLPNNAEFDELVHFVEGENDGIPEMAGYFLKTRYGWDGPCEAGDCDSELKNGVDSFGFSLKPNGRGNADGSFESQGMYGFLWSGTKGEYPWYFAAGYSYDYAGTLYSGDYVSESVHENYHGVRCIKGEEPPATAPVLRMNF